MLIAYTVKDAAVHSAHPLPRAISIMVERPAGLPPLLCVGWLDSLHGVLSKDKHLQQERHKEGLAGYSTHFLLYEQT